MWEAEEDMRLLCDELVDKNGVCVCLCACRQAYRRCCGLLLALFNSRYVWQQQ